MHKIKTIVAIMLAVSLAVLTACTQAQIEQLNRIEEAVNASAEQTVEKHVYQIEKKNVPFYLAGLDEENKMDIDLYFMDSNIDVPYITVDDFRNLLVSMFGSDPGSDYDITVTKEGEKITLSRETKYPMTIDCANDTIEFWDFDAFLAKTKGATLMDLIMYPGFNDEGEPELFQRSNTSFERYGDKVTFNPGKYEIDLICQDGEYYIPMQVASDIVLSQYSIGTLYNGEAAFLIASGNVDAVGEKYYLDNPPEERSQDLIDFNYRELCFILDALYGLKEQHDIDDFNTMFMKANLITQMLSKDPQVAGQALSDLTLKYFDDQHSAFIGRSYMMKENVEYNLGPSFRQSFIDRQRYTEARNKVYPDGPVPYEEFGNTAYITFDSFLLNGMDYYKDKAEDNLEDTIALMIYSYSQITRKDSPIENVVLDLSNNGGGMAPAAAFVIGTFIGEGSISVTNTLSGALVTQDYKVDVNLDRKFDEKDSLLDYNLFCLTTANSFSCGNLVPSALKNSHQVTMLGQTSGGGACVVHHLTTADGCPLRISGPSRLAYTKNGSFYDIDQGVEPDFVLASPDLFYDREYLTGYINDEILGKKTR